MVESLSYQETNMLNMLNMLKSRCRCPFSRQTPCPMKHRFDHRGLTVMVMVREHPSSRLAYKVLHMPFFLFLRPYALPIDLILPIGSLRIARPFLTSG